MTVSSIFSNTSSGSASSNGAITGNTASETSQMFTKLLVAQIQNQDPLAPTDPSQFVNQLSQLAQTESLQNLSNLTSASTSVLQSMQVLALGAQVGSDVMAETKSVTLDGKTAVDGQVTLAASSTNTKIILTGSDGQKHEIKLGTKEPGTTAFNIDPVKLGLKEGKYTLSVEGSSNTDSTIDIKGRLNSVRLAANGDVVLNIGNVGEASPAAITAFNGKSSDSATQSVL
jgi:flagellar basal-body rod modification protein FlgD